MISLWNENSLKNNFLLVKKKIKDLPFVGPYFQIVWQVFKKCKPSKIKELSHRFYTRIELIQTFNQLYSLAKNVRYQPLYGFHLFENKKLIRPCVERADAIYQEMKIWGAGARIVDIGCHSGYFTYYFTERGYSVDGIDNDPQKIKICQLLQNISKGKMNFSLSEFNSDYVEKITTDKYDVALLLGVVHHIIYYKGLDYAQNLMAQLLEKIPVLFVGLAIKEENTDAAWYASLPNDKQAIFAKCKNITIKKINEFSTHTSPARRPIYKIENHLMKINDVSYKIHHRKFLSFMGADYCGRHFYVAQDFYIKKHLLSFQGADIQYILQEIKNYEILPKNEFIPALLNVSYEKYAITTVFERFPGENLHDLLTQGKSVPIFQVIQDVIRTLKFLFQHGLYHNDIRLWNVIYDGKKSYLLDLGLASQEEIENTNIALLWMIVQLHHFIHYDFFERHKIPPILTEVNLLPEFVPLVNALQEAESFAEFINNYDTNETH